ncbi:MAG: peptidase M14, partial [Pseudomonadales bacterium]|nr:peptidase M14 [Pseudomonadales bacterium]
VGESRGVEHAEEFIEACLHLSEHPAQDIAARDIDLFHTTGVVHTIDGLQFAYDANARDLQLYKEIEYYNFRELPAGTAFGCVKNNVLPFMVKNEAGEDVSATYFALRDGEVVTTRALMPSMLTRDVSIIEQDCFCYLMERYPLETHSA